MKTIEVNGEKYVSIQDYDAKGGMPVSTKKRILVLQRSWVVIGDVTVESESLWHVTNVSVIRRWGTTEGLGELALKGPQPETILDKCGDLHLNPITIIMPMDVDESKW